MQKIATRVYALIQQCEAYADEQKGDRDKADEPAPVKRQIIVEPKVKQKTIVQAEPVVVKKKKVVVAAVPEVKKVVIADAEPQVEPEATPEVQPEAPAEEQAVTEAPAETPAAAFKVLDDLVLTGGDEDTGCHDGSGDWRGPAPNPEAGDGSCNNDNSEQRVLPRRSRNARVPRLIAG